MRVSGVLASVVSPRSRRGDGAPTGRLAGGFAAGQLAREVSALQASLLGKLHEEMRAGTPDLFAAAAQKLAEEFGSVTATAVGTLWEGRDGSVPATDG